MELDDIQINKRAENVRKIILKSEQWQEVKKMNPNVKIDDAVVFFLMGQVYQLEKDCKNPFIL